MSISANLNTGNIDIEISPDKMKAYLSVSEPPKLFTDEMVEDEVFKKINDLGISFGLDTEAIKRLLKAKKWGTKCLIAKGAPPVDGIDAKYEFSFRTSASPLLKQDSKGSLNYKELNLVQSTDKDAVLAKKIEAVKGSDGKNILGVNLPANPPKDVKLANGKGTYRDESNNNIIKAATEGVIIYDEESQKIEIRQVYTVHGSLDFSTGNLRIKSSIKIEGDVKPGFVIETPYNVDIEGVVEHATINCGGVLRVGAGITGNGKTVIKAGGDIHAGYIRNQEIHCGGSMYVANEIRNCTIECDDKVDATSGAGAISGGCITTKNGIAAVTIGSVNNISTSIEAGINTKLKKELMQKTSEKEAIRETMLEIKENAEKILKKTEGIVNEKVMALHKDFKTFKVQYEQIKEEVKKLEDEYYGVDNAKISVSDTVHRGTIIKIKKSALEIKEELSHVVFRLSEGNIAASPL